MDDAEEIQHAVPSDLDRENLDDNAPERVIVTGPSGAGRTTALNALEDLGYRAINGAGPALVPEILAASDPGSGRLAVGLTLGRADVGQTAELAASLPADVELLFIDCRREAVLRRYSETRRRHPSAPNANPSEGCEREAPLLVPLRAAAGMLIDSSDMTPHDLRAEVERLFAGGRSGLAVTVMSFSYKAGLPLGADLVFDCRFLRNPHWEPALRPLTGRDQAVADYVRADPRWTPYLERLADLVLFQLPEAAAEGKSHLTIAIGCTGGQHRSVALTEALAQRVEAAGWPVSSVHRELRRREGTGDSQPERVGNA